MENIVQGQWLRGPSADLGTPIDGSLRFNPDNNTRITRTLASGRSNTTSTIAFWFKNINSDWSDYATPTPFLAYTDSNNYVQFQFNRDERGMIFRCNAVVGGSNVIDKRTTGNFADPSAWYHLCVVFDTSNATAEDRTRIYVNGIRCTDFDTNTNCSQSQGTSVNSGVEHAFGGNTGFAHCGGFLADVYFLDGIAVSHDSDGVVDEFVRINDQGICVPKAYSGSYNTNGFHLDFNSTTLDTSNTRFTDQSGEDNHFTYANFHTTATDTAYFLSNDSPTDNYAVLLHNNGHPGAPGAPDCILGGTVANNWSSSHASISTSFAVKEGKYYWEWHRANTSTFHAGICDVETEYYKTYSGGNHFSIATDGQSTIYANGTTPTGSIGNVDNGETMGCAIDFDSNTFKAWVDGTAMNSGNDFLGSENIDRNDTGNTNNPRRISPVCGHSSGAEIEFHTGAHGGFTNGFRQTAAADHKKLRTSDLPELTITRPQDHFRVVNYAGGNSDRTINFGFRPDLVCIFQTAGSNTDDHNKIFDSCNGLTTGYYSMSIADAFSTSSDFITGVSDTGVTIKSGASNDGINEASHRYSAWGFKMGGAPTASNSNTSGAMAANSVSIDGVLQSAYTPSGSPTIYPYKMSINTEAKMSIIRYEGNSTDGATVPHGLGVAPACIWIKRMSANTAWRVYHHCEAAGAPKYLDFDATETIQSDDSWNSTDPNSNTFSLGQVSNVNFGSTYIAICFAEVPGFSAFGMNENNQDAEGAYAVTMFEPALVFGKDSARGDHWWCFDNAQNRVNTKELGYRTTFNSANNQDLGGIDFFANGFRHRAASGEHNYGDGAQIWFSFAHRPFGGENSAPNTAHFDSNRTEN